MLLQVDNLQTYFQTRRGVLKAVDGVSIEVHPGETIGIVGESGCGKSTLASTLMRLIPSPPGIIAGGAINYKGTNLLDASEETMRRLRGKEISMVFQDPMTYLNPVMTVGDQIAESIRLHRENVNVEEEVVELLDRVRMPDPENVAHSYPHQLSGGMKQRALIAMAIACNPAILIADEPTTALDVTVQAQILGLLKEIKDELGMSLLLITHDLGIVAEVCDRVYVMYAGKIVEQGTVFELFENPRHPYTRGLLNSVLSINEFKQTLRGIPGTVPDLISAPQGCRFYDRCPEAFDRCKMNNPPCFNSKNGHQVYCWLYEEVENE